jgi:DNA polymerase
MDDLSREVAARALIRWYAEMGVDEAVTNEPRDGFAPAEAPAPAATPSPITRIFTAAAAPPPADEAIRQAEIAASTCRTHDELAAAVAAFEGCGLKAGARTTVFSDGVAGADLLVIGEAPGRDEDACGKPFVGRAGQLLDKMLAAIDRSRGVNALISNVIYWRPPGNREPTLIEIAACKPFVLRLVEITKPKVVLLAGGVPTRALLNLPGIMRARGVWRELDTPNGDRYAAMPIYHPAFLLRQPEQKKYAWADLLAVERRLKDG